MSNVHCKNCGEWFDHGPHTCKTDMFGRPVDDSTKSRPGQQYSDELTLDCEGLTYDQMQRIVAWRTACEQRLLDRIGEPTLESFPYTPTPEEYKKMCDVIKWYKDRIAAIRSKL